MIKTFSKAVKFQEGDGYIHGFTTGMVKVKSKFKTAEGNSLTSKIHFLLDSEWTDFLPIWVWVIDHPEGLFVIDTGENAQVNDAGYFKQEGAILNFINTKSFAFDVIPQDEAGPQLANLGYKIKDIKSVVLTHLHLDHFDGLKHFENTDILVNKLEWDKPSFTLPSLYPDWFEPKTLQLRSNNHTFSNSISLVESKEIEMVHTPGHTMGHTSILVKTNELHYLLAGDVTYDHFQLENNILSGAHQSFKSAKNTFTTIKTYASKNKLVYLPSHDINALDRLKNDHYLQ